MRKTLVLTCLAILLVQLDVTILYIAFGAITKSFPGVSSEQLSWVLNIYTLIFGALLIPAGVAGDIYGRKKVFLIGVSIFTLASFLCGISPTAGFLIAMRLLQAIGSALLVPSSLGILLEDTDANEKTVAVSMWGASAALGAAIGPAVGGILISRFGWHSIFLVNVPVGIGICYGLWTLKSSLKTNPDRHLPSFLGVILIVVSMALLSFGLLAENKEAFSSNAVLPLVLGFTFLLLFILHTKYSSKPLLKVSLFKNQGFNVANVAGFIYFTSFAIMFFGEVQSLINEWHLPISKAGIFLLPGPLAVIPSAIITGKLARNYGYRRFIIAGALLVMTGVLYQRLTVQYFDSIYLSWIIGWVMAGIGNGMIMPSLAGAATITLDPSSYAMGSGVNNSIRQFGTMMGIALAVTFIGTGVASSDTYTKMFLVTVVMNLMVAMIIYLGFNRGNKKSPVG